MKPPPPVTRSAHSIVEGYVPVRLNHFMAANTETFPMRYYYNDEFARLDNNIVIFVGGEWAISPDYVLGGLAYDLAETMNAGLFYTEHRYYGLTRPSSNTSVPYMRFLSVDQALADLAQFIQYVKSDQFYNGRHRNARVALVGCSYAGSMATWMRVAYPHLVDAAFSDSGPLHAQEDFPEYLEVIAEAIRAQGGERCLASIEESMQALVKLLETSSGPATVSRMFNTCTTIQASSPLDLATFFWFGITETFAGLVQYAIPGDIPAACAVLTNASVQDPVQRLADWITSQYWTQPCIESRYSEVIAAHTNVSYDSPDADMRLWTYQTCVEFGWYQTTTSNRQPFLSTVPLEYFHDMCRDFFSANFDENLLRSGIKRTNLFFGGLTRLPDKVISVVGGHDPWSPMGPNATHAHFLAPVHILPHDSHCRAIGSIHDDDPAELRAVKLSVLLRMHNFATGSENSAASLTLAASLAVIFAILHAIV
ncbi:hypothetical protein O3G_MSEX010636 [Manduca sexta]|uniref:Serine protease K12H4.7 n=1 Tax=Manduca sexta TaxID=7130 RepID=A0A921ZHA6_MANSE|nr:hypothetical protein O3G_MSEX010636 [Manduca sexta]